MSNKMALDALTAALDAMEHMANTLNNMDAVDEDEDAQHDAAFEAVRVAIAELKKPQKSRIVAAPMASYPEADQRFFNFWYGHMFEDLMQPPLVGIDHATARYIWNAAAIAALQAEPQGWMPISEFPKDETYRDGHNIYSKHALAWWPGAMEVTRVRWWQRDDTDASNFIADGGYAVFPTVFHALPTPPKD